MRRLRAWWSPAAGTGTDPPWMVLLAGTLGRLADRLALGGEHKHGA